MLGIIRGFEGAKRRKEKEKQHLISFLVKCQSTEIQIVPSTLKLLDRGERKKQQEKHRQTEESSSRVAAGDVKLLHLQKKKKKSMWDQRKRICSQDYFREEVLLSAEEAQKAHKRYF